MLLIEPTICVEMFDAFNIETKITACQLLKL